MLMALLYSDSGEIVAAAPACDQYPLGSQYWHDVFEGELAGETSQYELGYINVYSLELQSSLMQIGIDANVDAQQLTQAVEQQIAPSWKSQAA